MTSYPTLLGTGGHGAASQLYSSETYYYSNVGLGRCAMETGGSKTEPCTSQTIHVDGSVSYLSWGLDTAFDATLTLTLNVNTSSTSLAVSIGSSTTGWVTDANDSVKVKDGDALDFATYVGIDALYSYSGDFYCVSARFDADSGSAQMLATVGPTDPYGPTTEQKFSNFLGILYNLSGPDPIEKNQRFQSLASGTWTHMACYLGSNGFTGTVEIRNRNDSTNGLLSIVIFSDTKGYFESPDTDSVSSNDFVDYAIWATVTGEGTIEVNWVGAHFVADNPALCMIGGSPGILAVEGGGTYYSSLFGGGQLGTIVQRATGLCPYDLRASKFTNFLTAADPDCTVTFTLLKNGSASALAVSSSAGQSGYFVDNSDSVCFVAGDTCANRVAVFSGEGGQTVTWAGAGLLWEAGGCD
jgi:hypothetical protein